AVGLKRFMDLYQGSLIGAKRNRLASAIATSTSAAWSGGHRPGRPRTRLGVRDGSGAPRVTRGSTPRAAAGDMKGEDDAGKGQAQDEAPGPRPAATTHAGSFAS